MTAKRGIQRRVAMAGVLGAWLVVSTSTLVGRGPGDPFTLSRSTVDGGGAMNSTGGEFELSGTIGQPDASVMTGGTFELTGGFWFALAPTDCNDDGLVSLLDHGTMTSCLLGPGAGINDPACRCFDTDGDSDVSIRDFAKLQSGLTAP